MSSEVHLAVIKTRDGKIPFLAAVTYGGLETAATLQATTKVSNEDKDVDVGKFLERYVRANNIFLDSQSCSHIHRHFKYQISFSYMQL